MRTQIFIQFVSSQQYKYGNDFLVYCPDIIDLIKKEKTSPIERMKFVCELQKRTPNIYYCYGANRTVKCTFTVHRFQMSHQFHKYVTQSSLKYSLISEGTPVQPTNFSITNYRWIVAPLSLLSLLNISGLWSEKLERIALLLQISLENQNNDD